MARFSRRHLFALSLGIGSTGCHLVRFTSDDGEAKNSLAETLKTTKPAGHPLDGPRRFGMKIITLAAPLRDKAIDESIWNTTDEQVITQPLRETLKNNGLRIGVLRSAIPADVEELMNRNSHAGKKIEPLLVNQPVNEPTKIAIAEQRPETSLLIDLNGKVQGKEYKDISGFFRLTCTLDRQTGATIKIIPELHHGPIRTSYGSPGQLENAFEPAQLTMKSAQSEELFRELTITQHLEEGHCLVIGLDSSREGGLGWFLLTDPPQTDKETQQKLILVWAWNASRDSSFNQPTVVQANSRQIKSFVPLDSPPASDGQKTDKKSEDKLDTGLQKAEFKRTM